MSFSVGDGLPVGRISGQTRASSATHRTGVNLAFYDLTAEEYVNGISIRGNLNDVVPGVDNLFDLGDGALRWAQIFAANGTINTSDAREKQQIGGIPDAWLDAWGDVQWSRFKWNQSVADKGAGARWHVGLIAQQVERVFAAHGLDAFEIGLLCHDRWDAESEPVIETVTDPETGETSETDTGEVRITLPAGDRLGIRYDQAQALEAAWMRRALERLGGL